MDAEGRRSRSTRRRIAQIDVDPVKASIPLWGFPVDLPLLGDTSKALPLLLAAVERRATPERRAAWRGRRERLEDASARRRQRARERLEEHAHPHADHPETGPRRRSARCCRRTPSWSRRPSPTRRPSAATSAASCRARCSSPIGPGLGWALGGGRRRSSWPRPDRLVVAVVGDGSFVFGSPVAALYAAQQAEAPFLTVILNNSGYNASKSPIVGLFPHGASVQANAYPGVRFEEPPDYAALARSCHAYGERVEDPAEMVPARSSGPSRRSSSGQSAVLDVIIDPI